MYGGKIMSRISAELFMTSVYDKTAAAVTAAELEGFEPIGDPSLTFQNVADSGCPYTQQLLMAHPELANEPYDETIINVLGLQPQTPGMVPAVMPQAVPAVVNPELAGAAGGGYGMPLSMIGGGVLGAAAGGALGNYIGNQYDSIDPNNAALIDRLAEAGVKMELPETVKASDKLAGKSIVISGTFARHSREEYKSIIEQHGGKNVSSISKKTSFVFAGDNMGPHHQLPEFIQTHVH